jgi:GDP-4-dehydro-6-deoxy-D-mannose reductase
MARVLLVGSSKEYSDSIISEMISEITPCNPTNFYGVSKYVAELIGLQYARQYGMDVRCSRSFNHTGPGQPPRFVCSDWTKQVADIHLGKQKPIMTVGDINPSIDFTDVRDVVRAYSMILEKGKKGSVYNVCSGNAISLKELLQKIKEKTDKKITIAYDDARRRLNKTSIKITGDNSLLIKETGWVPEISIDKNIDDLFNYWLVSQISTLQ